MGQHVLIANSLVSGQPFLGMPTLTVLPAHRTTADATQRAFWWNLAGALGTGFCGMLGQDGEKLVAQLVKWLFHFWNQ
jgi:hypothetical protein